MRYCYRNADTTECSQISEFLLSFSYAARNMTSSLLVFSHGTCEIFLFYIILYVNVIPKLHQSDVIGSVILERGVLKHNLLIVKRSALRTTKCGRLVLVLLKTNTKQFIIQFMNE